MCNHIDINYPALMLVRIKNSTFNKNFNPIRSGGGGGFKSASPIFCSHAFNFEATLLCVGDLSQKIVSHRMAKNFLIGGHDLAVRGVSKYKVDMIFIIFREFNTMLEIVNS